MTSDEEREAALERILDIMYSYNKFKENLDDLKKQQQNLVNRALDQATQAKRNSVLTKITNLF
jgi:hypothetical protein